MRILITGGTGLIGRALCRYWIDRGHEVLVWSRSPGKVAALCSGARGIARLSEAEDGIPVEAVVNLAGAPIADRPWTRSRRALLWRSRIDLTRELIDWMSRQSGKPKVLISGSAVGWYGDCGDELLDESSPRGHSDFGSELCEAWEKEAARAIPLGMRVAIVRTAVVLSSQGGMLPRLTFSFKLKSAVRFGKGTQWMPWIHIDDQVRLIDFLLRKEECSGVYIAAAPGQINHTELVQVLSGIFKSRMLLVLPEWFIRLSMGEVSTLMLSSQRVQPAHALAEGFEFTYPEMKAALSDLLR